jgi:PAS domain S-box-containing protein
MAKGLRNSGISVMGDMTWGTHFCHFYESKQDLLDTLVPYFKAGLDDKEFCLWVISDPLTEEEAWNALSLVVPNLDRHRSDQSIAMVAGRDWYLKGDTVNLGGVLNIWNEKLNDALARGYDGLRVSGDTCWLTQKNWRDFCEYEKQLNDSIADRPMTVLCTYPLARSGAAEILDVARNHQFALARRGGNWDVIETPELKQAKEEIRKLNEQLEQRGVERTAQLTEANARVDMILDSITDNFFSVDKNWRYTYFNKHAEDQLRILGKVPASLIGRVLWDVFPNATSGVQLRHSMNERTVVTDENYSPSLGEWYENRIYPNPDGGLAIFQRYVTERKIAEEEQRKLASLVENSTDFIGIASPEGQVLFVNPAGLQMVGLSGDEQLSATAIVDFIDKGEQERFLNEILPAVVRDGRWEGELRIKNFRGGAAIPMLHHLFFIKEVNGRRLALATIGRDMTSRKRAEKTLLESERKFSIIFDRAPFAISLARLPEGLIVDINEAWLKMYGFSRQEVVGRTSLELGINRDPEARTRLFAELQERGFARDLEMTFFTKSGDARFISCNIDVVVVGREKYLLATMHDVTENRRAEQERRRAEAYLREGQRLSHTGSWAWNVATGDLFWSEEHYRIFGLDPEKFTLTIEGARQFIHPDDQLSSIQTFETAISENNHFEYDFRIVRADGEIRYVHSLAHPVFDESGKLIEYVGTIMDTTERKLDEQALRHAHAELAHASRVLTVGELTSSIAHELNQPLGAIVTNGNASLRLLSRETADVEGTREAIDCMISDAMRASEVIKRIRTLLKKTAPEKVLLDINETIGEVIALSASELLKNQVTMRTALGADLPAVHGDRVQLQQVLLNLILNGNEAISKSTWQPREIVISSRKSKTDEVTVELSDSGIGVKPEDKEHIFDAFKTSKEGGLGLGLSISRTIVEAHGGKLWTTPKEGKGATFLFTLPTGDVSPKVKSARK